MEHDDEVGEVDSTDAPELSPVQRRSTFTPPVAPQPVPPRQSDGTDDDSLADALAADLDRIASGPITIIRPEAVPGWAARTAPAAESAPIAPPAAENAAPAAPAPAWSGFPAPDPSDAVPREDGPPVRKSLPDEELTRWVAEAGEQPGGTLDIMQQLETQMRLREDEAREFRAWEDRMRSLGTPDALSAVDEAKPQFSDVLPDAPSSPAAGSFVRAEEPVADWPAPDFADTAPVAPVPVESIPDEAAPDEPASESAAPAPSSAWAPPSDGGEDAVVPDEEKSVEAVPSEETASLFDTLADAPAPEPAARAPFDWSPEPVPVESPAEEPTFEEPTVDEPASEVPTEDVTPESVEPEEVESASPFDALADAPAPEPTARAPFDWSPEPAPVPVESTAEEPTSGAPTEDIAPESVEEEAEPASPFDALADAPAPEPVIPADASDDDDVVIPTLEPEAEVDDEHAPELTVEPLPDTGPETLTPPPLIEPAVSGAPAERRIPAPFSFDDALAGPPVNGDEDDQPVGARAFDWSGSAPVEPRDTAPEALFIEPISFTAGVPVPTDTGSITLVDQSYDEDLDDDVDETDRAFEGLLGPVAVDAAGIAAAQPLLSPPSGPIATARIPEHEQVLFDDEPVRQPVFSIEDSDLEPTPVDHRVGRAARLFWVWFAANSSILSLALGASVFAVGLSLRQSIVAILAGVAISFIPLGLTTLAGKRSGQPTMVVSRASFGLIGNALPAGLALVTRLFWGAVLLWILGSAVAIVLVGAGLEGSLGERGILLVSLAGAFLIAVLVAFAGYPMIARIQLILSLVSAILVIGLIAMTYQYIDIPQALTVPDGPWLLTITGAVLVFSFVGLVWAQSGADLARYQRTDSSGASSMLWATFGTSVPSFILIGYGALLAASDKGIAAGFLLSPLDTLAAMLPDWYPAPLLAAAGLSLLSGIIISLYSGGFALQSLGVRVKRQWSIVIVSVLLGALALVLGFGVTGGLNELFRDAATTLAVPTAAWAGIFAAETMIRNRRFESQSLVRRGGVYADVRWVNLVGLILFTVVGLGLTTASVSWLSWQGYGFTLLGVPLDSDLAGTDLGVLAALVLGLLLPIVAGIPAIRKQEAARAPE